MDPAHRPEISVLPHAGGPAVRPAGPRITNEAFYQAIVAAGRAPSAYNAQPWRWRVTGGQVDLYADHDRMSRFADPEGRLTVISCGAALHHARLTLAARGWRVTVTRLPDTGDPDHLARLCIDGEAPVSPDTAELARLIEERHTDLRPVTGDPIEEADTRTVAVAFETQHVGLAVLRPDQILELASATAPDGDTVPDGAQWHTALAEWAGTHKIAGGPRLSVTSGEHDRAATFAVIHGPDDEPLSWLHAGEALSAGSLVAAGLGVSILPFSAPIAGVAAASALRRAVPDVGHPHLMVRLARYATEPKAQHTTRRPAEESIDRP
ncbi:nitroreductase [Actinoplanes sp. NPDC049265]|uniref:nitroreductase n=1 Tax=Actinoplanes sp. NPDC049265 TaxID=3363902 RepID=UPI00371EC7E9